MDLVGGMRALSLVLGGMWLGYWTLWFALAVVNNSGSEPYFGAGGLGWLLLIIALFLAPPFLLHFVVCAFFPQRKL